MCHWVPKSSSDAPAICAGCPVQFPTDFPTVRKCQLGKPRPGLWASEVIGRPIPHGHTPLRVARDRLWMAKSLCCITPG